MKYDILIVGGGLVGNALACALAPLGLNIAVVEAFSPKQQQHDDFDVRSFALSYGSQQLLAAWGLWQPVAPYATPIKTIHVSEKGRLGRVLLTAAQSQLPTLGCVVPVTRLYEALIEQVKGLSNVTQYCPSKVSAATQTASGWQVQLGTQAEPLTADLVIAADGAKSLLRQAAGLQPTVKDYHQTALAANIQLARPHNNIAYERFTPQGPCALLPALNNKVGLIWTFPPEAIDTALSWTDDVFLKHLQRYFGYRAGKFVKVGKRQTYPLKLSVLDLPYKPGLLVMGNAAHSLHPISGQGLNLSLRDVAVLKDTLLMAQQAQQPLGAMSTLAGYQQARDADQHSMIRYTDGLHHVFTAKLLGASLARSVGLQLLQSSNPLKRWFSRANLGQTH